ncbi:hypothetical protein ACFL01_04825 [Planctomycetota bacterium]
MEMRIKGAILLAAALALPAPAGEDDLGAVLRKAESRVLSGHPEAALNIIGQVPLDKGPYRFIKKIGGVSDLMVTSEGPEPVCYIYSRGDLLRKDLIVKEVDVRTGGCA